MTTPYLQFALAAVAGWVNRSQQDVIEYLRVENRILHEHLGGRRVRFTDAQRCRLFLRHARYLIHDRDPLFTAGFRANLKSAGVETVKLPVRSPNLNAYAERFVLSIKSECLSKIIPLGERHLRLTVGEFSHHYHMERNHQGLGNRLIERSRGHPEEFGRVACRERLGGVLKYYYREAA